MDLAIVAWAAENLHTPLFDRVMPFITMLGEYGFIWIIFGLLLLIRRDTRRFGIICFAALLLNFLLGEIILKNLISRPRPFTLLPEITLLIPPPSSFSFPSGHTASSFTAAVAICFYDKRYGVAALILALLIAFSRLYLSVHYPTDIIAGILLGVACAFAARWGYASFLEKKLGKKL